MPPLLLLAALLTLLLPLGALAQATTGTLQGTVRAQPEALPIAYAVVSISQLNIERFTDGQGRFRLTKLAPGRYELMVRRIGFAPYRGNVTIEGGSTTTTDVQLTRIPVQLQSLTVQAMARCANPGVPDGDVNPAVASLVSLLRENANRYRLLVSQYPFAYAQVRAVGVMVDETAPSAPFRLQQIDTVISVASTRADYRPGQVVRRERLSSGLQEYRMLVPSILDLVDDAFARAHCFAFGGREQRNDETWLRLDVRASDRLREPDVHGSFWLDSATSQLRSMRLELSRPDRLPRTLGGVTSVTVTTRFLEIAPGLAIIESMCGITRPRTGRRSSPVPLQGELQQLASYRFTNAPDGVAGSVTLPLAEWRSGDELARAELWCADQDG